MVPSHWVQYFRNHWALHGSSPGSPWAYNSCQQTWSSVGSSVYRSIGSARTCSTVGFQWGLQPLLGIHILQPGICHRRQMDLWSTMGSPWDTRAQMFHHSLHYRLKGNLFSAWNTSCPFFFTGLGICRAFSLSSSHSSLRLLLLSHSFIPLLEYVIPEMLSLSLMGLALGMGRSITEPPSTCSIRHRKLLTEANPCGPTKKPHINSI